MAAKNSASRSGRNSSEGTGEFNHRATKIHGEPVAGCYTRPVINLRRAFAVFVLGSAAFLHAASAKPGDCARNCLVTIEGLQDAYSSGSHADLKIRNQSKRNLDINVAIEGLEGGSWTEVVGSVSDPEHSFSKTLKLSPLKTAASLPINFSPCETPILIRTGDSLGMSEHPCSKPVSGASVPTLLRLRVDVLDRARGRFVQRVRSAEFRLLPGDEPH